MKLLTVAESTSGSNLKRLTRSAVSSSQCGLQLSLKPPTPVSLHLPALLSVCSDEHVASISSSRHDGRTAELILSSQRESGLSIKLRFVYVTHTR